MTGRDVVCGLEVLVGERRELVAGRRLGLLSHPAAVDRSLRSALEVLAAAGGRIERLFAPEHGASGGLQDMVASDEARDAQTGLPVVSLYGETESSLTPQAADLDGLDALVIDLVDVGARYYTFVATAVRCLEAAARAGLAVIVADRPNPIGGELIEGNLVARPQRSFVGELPVPNRHGLTLGELCCFAVEERGLDVELEVVPCRGWRRASWADETGLPWVMPSPNMPTLETATVYPGACLVEGTNLSEGRGTTRPFELVGAPFLEPRAFAGALSAEALPGAAFRPVSFRPAFQKHRHQNCGGVQIHVTDRRALRPVLTGVALLVAARRLAPAEMRWRTETYEFVDDQPAIDLLAGTPAWREAIDAGASPREIAADWPAQESEFLEKSGACRLYGL